MKLAGRLRRGEQSASSGERLVFTGKVDYRAPSGWYPMLSCAHVDHQPLDRNKGVVDCGGVRFETEISRGYFSLNMDTRDGGASNPNGSHGKPVLLVTHLPFALACLILVARCTLERTLIFEACGFGPSLCLTGHRLMLTALIVTVYLKNEKCNG